MGVMGAGIGIFPYNGSGTGVTHTSNISHIGLEIISEPVSFWSVQLVSDYPGSTVIITRLSVSTTGSPLRA